MSYKIYVLYGCPPRAPARAAAWPAVCLSAARWLALPGAPLALWAAGALGRARPCAGGGIPARRRSRLAAPRFARGLTLAPLARYALRAGN